MWSFQSTTASAHCVSVDRSGTATTHYAVSTAHDVPTNVFSIATNFTARDEHDDDDDDDDDDDADDDAKSFDSTNGPCGSYGEFRDSCGISEQRSKTIFYFRTGGEPYFWTCSFCTWSREIWAWTSEFQWQGWCHNGPWLLWSIGFGVCTTKFNRTQLLQFAFRLLANILWKCLIPNFLNSLCAQPLQVSCVINTLFDNIHSPQNSDWSQMVYTLLLKRLGRDLQASTSRIQNSLENGRVVEHQPRYIPNPISTSLPNTCKDHGWKLQLGNLRAFWQNRFPKRWWWHHSWCRPVWGAQ